VCRCVYRCLCGCWSERSSDVASQHVPASAGVCLRACVCVYVCVRVGAGVHVFFDVLCGVQVHP